MVTKRDDELETALTIGRRAAEVVKAIYATPFEVELKGQNDPVTRADREANALICEALAAAFPGDAVIAEESVPTDPSEIARLVALPRIWFVDPLDGTKEFTDRIGEFAVMIGLAVNGRAVLGVVVRPTTDEAMAGRVGSAAFMEDGKGARRPLAVSTVSDPSQATLMVSRSHRPPVVEPVCARLGITRLTPSGSVGVKVARVATAEAEIYVHGGRGAKRWDTCGPEAILVAAGGRFTDLAGRRSTTPRPTWPCAAESSPPTPRSSIASSRSPAPRPLDPPLTRTSEVRSMPAE
jgi:3'(2'), 5'-bisphosphate nucleotidase